jgi:methyl-accepting chemotaxis protein
VAKQVEMYLKSHPSMTVNDMRNDAELRQIAVQPVGTTGYTTIINPANRMILIHKFWEQERDVTFLKDMLPKFWALLLSSDGGQPVSGYYDWLEVDGSITEKYAAIIPIQAYDGSTLTLWATTYIDEFSQPVQETRKEINTAILDSGIIINNRLSTMQNTFVIYFCDTGQHSYSLALLLSRCAKPITALTQGAEAIGQGNLDYQLKIRNKDELGVLAMSFNRMGAALKNHTEELKTTAAENLSKEKTIQEYLRLYVQKISQAQEAERKRIARELHDEIGPGPGSGNPSSG